MAVDVGESSHAHTVVAACIVLPIITLIFLLFRIYSRVFIVRCLGWDDYTATVVLLFCITYSVLVGLSTDANRVPREDPAYVKWINDADMIYLVSLIGYKFSILILYLRLFGVNRKFRHFTLATIVFVAGYLVANLTTQIFGCWPRAKYWRPDIPGHCINYTKAGLAYGSMNFVSDLLIFILPLPVVWRLKLSRREKIGISLIFLSGAITCIVAVIRYVYIVKQNQANAEYFVWSILEINVGVICSCMPALRPFFARIIPKIDLRSLSLSRIMTRSRYRHQSSEELEQSAIIELEPHRSTGCIQNDTAEQSPNGKPHGEEGIRNIIAF